MASYIYDGLPEPRTIRLLTLYAGKNEDEVAIALSNASLNDPPEYEALSYTWGDANDTRPVRYGGDGTTMRATVNLHVALKHLRHTDRPRILWVDALCINQSDLNEKSTQIPLMAEVYSSARQVLIWLGAESDDDSLAFRSIRMAILYLPTGPPGDARVVNHIRGRKDSDLPFATWAMHDRFQSSGSPYKIHWAQILALFRRPYFHRLWVVQEIAKARQAVAICGHQTIPWKFIHKIATCLVEVGFLSVSSEDMAVRDRDMTTVIGQTEALSFGLRNVRTIALIAQDPYRKLADLLTSTMVFQCSDPRDHVFALLGLASDLDGYDEIKPDYTIDARDLFRRVSLSVIRKERDLRILPSVSRVAHHSPTWVPQFDKSEAWLSHEVVSRLFRASGDMPLQVHTSDDERVLYLYGKSMDEIESLGPTLMSIPLLEPADCKAHLTELIGAATPYGLQIYTWFRRSRDFAEVDMSQDGTDRFEAFGETIMCGNIKSTITFSRYVRYLDDLLDGSALPEDPGLSETTISTYDTCLLTLAKTHCLCITKAGRFCLVPTTAKVGDSIWVVFGWHMPYVLRLQDQGRFSYVSECYAHGLMNGEAMDAGIEAQEFALV